MDPIARFEEAIRGLTDAPAAPQGAWPLPVAVAHCAQSLECSVTGYPRLRSAVFRVTIGALAKRKFLAAGKMSHNTTAAIPGATPIAETITLADARERALAAARAFTAYDGPLPPHLAYGRCTKPEIATLQWLHLADHLRVYGIG